MRAAVRVYQQRLTKPRTRCEKAFDMAIEQSLRENLAAGAGSLPDAAQRERMAAHVARLS